MHWGSVGAALRHHATACLACFRKAESYGMARGLEAPEWQGMGSLGSPCSLPLLPTVLATNCGCGGRESKTKIRCKVLLHHYLRFTVRFSSLATLF